MSTRSSRSSSSGSTASATSRCLGLQLRQVRVWLDSGQAPGLRDYRERRHAGPPAAERRAARGADREPLQGVHDQGQGGVPQRPRFQRPGHRLRQGRPGPPPGRRAGRRTGWRRSAIHRPLQRHPGRGDGRSEAVRDEHRGGRRPGQEGDREDQQDPPAGDDPQHRHRPVRFIRAPSTRCRST